MPLLRAFASRYPIQFPELKHLTLIRPAAFSPRDPANLSMGIIRQRPDCKKEEKFVERFRLHASRAGILGAHNCVRPGRQDGTSVAFDITAQGFPSVPLVELALVLSDTRADRGYQFNLVRAELRVSNGPSPKKLAELTRWTTSLVTELGGVTGLPDTARTFFSQGIVTIVLDPV